jgi:hypothetical protein
MGMIWAKEGRLVGSFCQQASMRYRREGRQFSGIGGRSFLKHTDRLNMA